MLIKEIFIEWTYFVNHVRRFDYDKKVNQDNQRLASEIKAGLFCSSCVSISNQIENIRYFIFGRVSLFKVLSYTQSILNSFVASLFWNVMHALYTFATYIPRK